MRRTKIDREMGFVRICFKKQRRRRGGFGLDVNFQATAKFTFLKNLAILYWMYHVQALMHWNCIKEGTLDEFLKYK